ncbi:hypothetical protein [Proteus phage RP7]|nr:hypothetical protein [Proteus phage RP7]
MQGVTINQRKGFYILERNISSAFLYSPIGGTMHSKPHKPYQI